MLACSALFVAAWLIPNHYPPWLTFHSDALAAAAACLMAVAALPASTSPITVPRPAVFFVALALIPAAQAVAGKIVFAGDAWIVILYLLCAAWTVLWSARLASSPHLDGIATLAAALLAGALASCFVAMVQRWDIDVTYLPLQVVTVRPGNAPFGNLGQPNQLASLVALGMAALMLLFERRRVSLGWAMAAAVLLTFTLVMTQSRTPLLFFIAAILCAGWFRKRIGGRTRPSVIVGLALLWAALYSIWDKAVEAMGLPVAAHLGDRLKAGPRTSMWAQLSDAVLQQPWTGFGWNQVSEASMAVATRHAEARAIEHGHNLLLDLILWNGLPLGILIICLASAWLWSAARRVRGVDGMFGFMVIIVLLMHAMLEFPLDYLYFLVPFSAGIGIVVADSGSPALAAAPRSLGLFGIAVFASLLGWIVVDYAGVEEKYRDMRFAIAKYGAQPSPEALAPIRSQFTQLSAFHRFMLALPRPGMTQTEVAWTRDVAYRYPYAPSLYRYALVQALNGQSDGAEATFRQLRLLWGPKLYESAKMEVRNLSQNGYPQLRDLNLP